MHFQCPTTRRCVCIHDKLSLNGPPDVITTFARHLADVCQVNHDWFSQLSSEMALLYMDIWQMSCRCLVVYPATSARHLPDVCSVILFCLCVCCSAGRVLRDDVLAPARCAASAEIAARQQEVSRQRTPRPCSRGSCWRRMDCCFDHVCEVCL